MKKYIYIGIGGFLGAVARVYLKNVHIYHYKAEFPLNTLIINVTGSLILAIVLTTAFEIWKMDEAVRLGIATGFLGAYTTFSTLCKESVLLVTKGLYFSAISYVALSTLLGLCAAYFGIRISRGGIAKLIKDKRLD